MIWDPEDDNPYLIFKERMLTNNKYKTFNSLCQAKKFLILKNLDPFNYYNAFDPHVKRSLFERTFFSQPSKKVLLSR